MKRLISSLLALLLLIVPLRAAEAESGTFHEVPKTYTASELCRIENEREQLYTLLRIQLKEQGAEKYFDTFRYLADDYIQAKYYSINTMEARGTEKVYAPDGGWTSAENSQIFMFSLYLDEADTQKAYDNRGKDLTERFFSSLGWKFISKMVGFPFLGSIANFSQNLSSSLSWEMIMDSTKCLCYTNSYDKADMKNIVVQMPWYSVPYITLPDSSNYTTAYGVT